MKYILVIALFIMSHCGCSTRKEKSLGKVGSAVRTRIFREFNLMTGGTGALGPGNIKGIEFYFISESTADLADARMLIVSVVKAVISEAQADHSFQLELDDPPFREKHVYISIGFPSRLGPHFDENLIDRVSFSKGGINYSKMNHFTERFETVYKETYEEALQKLEVQ